MENNEQILLKFKLILMHNKISKFMQDADLFRDDHVLYYGTADITLTKELTKEKIDIIIGKFSDEGYNILAIMDEKNILYREPTVNEITDGHTYMKLSDFIDLTVIA